MSPTAIAASTQRVLVTLVAAAVACQFFLAGAGAFAATSFGPHRALGWAVLLVTAIAFLVALAARRLVRHSGALLLLVGIQVALGVLGADTQAWFGALHGLNALAVMAAAGTLARRTRLPG
jgi:hypothetical protein